MTQHAIPAPERILLRMSGADAGAVLQGVVTNDVDRLEPGKSVYAALLTPQGKYLFDFFLIADGADILIDIARDRASALATRLGMYCLRRDARIEPGPDWQVVLVWGGTRPETGALCLPDPRNPALGWRLYGPDAAAIIAGLDATPGDYTALRIAHGVPETGIELVPETTFILEANFEALSGVDFRKGCYVGQEVTARMKHKATLRKGLVRVDVRGTAPPGTPITAGDKPAGTLFSSAGGKGLAHLRLDRAGTDMQADEARIDLATD